MGHIRFPALSGLGRNPAAPDDVLVRAARHPAGRQGITLRKSASDAVVEVLLAEPDRSWILLLPGDRVSPAMRDRIAADPDPAIHDGYPRFVRDMVELGASMDIGAIEQAYGLDRAALAAHADPRLRAAAARDWPDRPPETQARLLADAEPKVRAAATRTDRPGIPPGSVDRFLADPATRANVAEYAPLTPDQVNGLLDLGDEDIIWNIAANPHLPADTIAFLAGQPHPALRKAAATSRHVDADTRDRLFALVQAGGDRDSEIALSWADGPEWLRDEPLDVRLSYLDSPHATFRRVLATCRDLPAAAWERLDQDPDFEVRGNAAHRPDTPPEVLWRLLLDGVGRDRPPLPLDHPHLPRHRLAALVDEPDVRLRRMALDDDALPAEILRRLATDPDVLTRRGVAGHPMAPGDLLTSLLADPHPSVVDAAAANPALPPAAMYGILAAADL